MATSPDLPPPITPDLPDPPEPADLPVEPDEGTAAPAGSVRCAAISGEFTLRSRVHRGFMCAAVYRWPRVRLVARVF
jgi:hypothetical protein